jgi:glutamate dehydrogenase/leucine dehydrogenase
MSKTTGLFEKRAEGVEMLIAIDSTQLGPALGGCRWKVYPDREAAKRDAVALAAAMTRKAAMAQLALGGGKAVVIGDPNTRTRAQLLAFGQFVQELGGRYITAADMGTGEEAMAVISEATEHVAGLPKRLGGCGDPGRYTAIGLRLAIRAAAAERGLDPDSIRVAVQGTGSVGGELVRLLARDGASLVVSDANPDKLRELPEGVEVVSADSILEQECDVLAPCGPPFVIEAARVPRLRTRIVCGAANNQLAEPSVADRLAERGILYVPDYLANAGGLIHLAVAREGGDEAATLEHLQVIPENLTRVLARAKAEGLEPAAAADRIALERSKPC